MEFYLAYIFVLMFLLMLDFYLTPKKRLFEKIALVVIIIVSGIRYKVGYDYTNYEDNFHSGYLDPALEPGFLGFLNILRALNVDSLVMFFLMGIGIYTFFYAGIRKHTEHSGIALLIFMLIPGLYLNSLSIIRQEFAIAVAFYAFFFLDKKKYIKYGLLMVLAFSFHFTVLFIVFIHLIAVRYAKKITPKQYFIIVGVSLVFSVLHLENLVVQYTYSKYLDLMSEAEQVSIVKTLVLNGTVVLMLFFYDKLCKKEFNKYVVFFVVLATVMVNVFSSFVIFTRISYYFRAFEVIFIAELVYIAAKKYRPLVIVAVLAFYLSMFIGSLKNDIDIIYDGPKMTPYKTFLNP